MKPPAKIAASIWERFKKPLVTLLGNDAEALAALERRLVPEIRKAIETERAGWPTEEEWMEELSKSVGEWEPKSVWRIALYRLQKRVLDGHA